MTEIRFADEVSPVAHRITSTCDENGNRMVGQPVTVWWATALLTGLEDKPAPEFGFNWHDVRARYATTLRSRVAQRRRQGMGRATQNRLRASTPARDVQRSTK
jgi:hypothetical protein